MKAVILCGGEGSRLRPLTCNIPKPLTRLCGRPIVDYILDKLVETGVTEAILTLKYLAEDIISWFEENPRNDIELRFSMEDSPLGTAGSVAKCRENVIDGDFIVVSGDALFDFNLTDVIGFHKKNQAVATIITCKVENPTEYGAVIADSNGKIEGFCEKPDWSQAVSNNVNTGIYILNPAVFRLIPRDIPFDFASDLFPKMLFCKHRLLCFPAKGYWCDIGSIEAYKQCQFDMLERKIKGISIQNYDCNNCDYSIAPPVYIGKNVSIGKGAVIGPNVIIDDNSSVGSGTGISKSVVLENSYVGSNCEIRGALICKNGTVESTGRMFEGSVLGSNSRVGIGAKISTNVRIWPDKLCESGSCVNTNLKWGTAFSGIFDEDGISGESGAEITPELCAKAGQALATVTNRGRIVVGFDGQLASKIYSRAFTAGLSACGSQAIVIGVCWDTLLMSFVKLMEYDAGVFFDSAGNKTSIHICGSDGLNLTRPQERKFDLIIKSNDFARCGYDEYRNVEKFDGAKLLIAESLMKRFKGNLRNASITCCCADMSRFCEDLLKNLSVTAGDIKFHIASSGHCLTGIDEKGRFISAQRMSMLIAKAVLAGGEDIAIPSVYPKIAEEIADKYGRHVHRYPLCPADDSYNTARQIASVQRYFCDGIVGMLKLLSYLEESRIKLYELNNSIPSFDTKEMQIRIEGNVQDAVSRLAEYYKGKYELDGIRIREKDKDVYCRPSKRGNGIRISVRAYDMESAKEFCADLERHL